MTDQSIHKIKVLKTQIEISLEKDDVVGIPALTLRLIWAALTDILQEEESIKTHTS